MGRFSGSIAVAAALALLAADAQAQAPQVGISVGGRAQFQFSTSSIGEDELLEPPASSNFETRRIRLRIDLDIGDWITARIQPDFAMGNLRLADAYVDFALSDYFDFKVGQFKRPFSLIELTSSTVFPTIERGVRIRGLGSYIGGVPGEQYEILGESGYVGRDIGASLRGGTDRFGWEVGVFNGQGPDASDANDEKSVATRITASPIEDAPLTIGAGFVHQDGVVEDGQAFEVDLEWGGFRQPGVHLMAEAAFGDDRLATSGASFSAVQGILSWFTPLNGPRFDGLELVGRASWGDPNDEIEGDDGVLLTPGITLYVFGRNRIMGNWDIYLPAADALETQHALRAQAQVYF